MKEPFFSIILPVFNGEAFLREALGSVLSQTFARFELIAVDDGSTDGTSEILSSAHSFDSRVRIIRLPANRGLSAARNAGMDAATGEYLIFMDADDAVEPGLYALLYNEIQIAPPDLAVFGLREAHISADGETMYEKAVFPERGRYEGHSALLKAAMALEARTLLGYAWNKAYRMEAAKAIRFENAVLIEDFLFNMDFLASANSMITLDIAPYVYRVRSASNLTARFEPEYYPVHRRRIHRMYSALSDESLLDGAALSALANRYCRYILSAAMRNLDPASGMNRPARREFIRFVHGDELFISLRPHMKGIAGFAVKRRPCLAIMARLSRVLKRSLPAAFAKIKKYAH